ncbi:MAG: ribulose-phosphate 3-epimerase [Clostridiales Family XIII bacterium]|jgi:ribulose-phosphate 3-epimerase|nr:ribulose-phosphate 3-epimerase [Clostridiales Family XIII bacterium]
MMDISVSILNADFADLDKEVNLIKLAGAKNLHIDVMDGHFVPNISFGSLIMKSLLNKGLPSFDVHLMITDPKKYYRDFLTNETEFIVFHYESAKNTSKILELINLIKQDNIKAGISIKPETKINVLLPFLDKIDSVLVMSVEPGFGGQKFMEDSLIKVQELVSIRKAKNLKFLIEIDGGIKNENFEKIEKAGADIAVIGSCFFDKVKNEHDAKVFRKEIL